MLTPLHFPHLVSAVLVGCRLASRFTRLVARSRSLPQCNCKWWSEKVSHEPAGVPRNWVSSCRARTKTLPNLCGATSSRCRARLTGTKSAVRQDDWWVLRGIDLWYNFLFTQTEMAFLMGVHFEQGGVRSSRHNEEHPSRALHAGYGFKFICHMRLSCYCLQFIYWRKAYPFSRLWYTSRAA